MALHENDYLTAGQLSETLGLKPSTITRFVDKLESRELCQRKYEGKLAKISITKKGKKVFPLFQEAWKVFFNNYNDVYGKENAEKLNSLIVEKNKKGES